ncbi:MFS transporter [Sphingobium sp. TB-6]|uniref:MFS transporter n=1 Tax=Sphingobium sp. TB-6 TaxID=2728850 RepID=UPI00146BE372|nr:MFS transporter [Sphingobium sp. TB-6]NML87666.1 MFS transporter [Sphingobium sp. TB-6]
MNYAGQDDIGITQAGSVYPHGGMVWYTMGILSAGWVMAYLDRYIISVLIEPMRQSLSLSDTQLSLVQGMAFALFFVVAGIPIGRLVDRTNRRNVLLFGISCWSLATIACGLSENFWQLFASRLAVGIGEACLAPASFSIVSDLIPPKRRGAVMGIMVGGTALGNAGSVFIGGLLLQVFGLHGVLNLPILGAVSSWQLVFIVVGAPGLLVALLLLAVREPVRLEKARAVIDNKAFFKFVRQQPSGFGLTLAALTANMFALNGFVAWLPVILMRIHHMPPAQMGTIIGAVLLSVGVITPPIGGALGDWLSRRYPAIGRLGPLLIAYPLLALLQFSWWFLDGPFYAILVFTVSAPLLGNIIAGATYPALTLMVPNEMRGQVTTLFLLIGTMVGIGFAPTAVALVTDNVFHDPTMLRQSVILVALPAFIAGFILTLLALKPYRRTCELTARAVGTAPGAGM